MTVSPAGGGSCVPNFRGQGVKVPDGLTPTSLSTNDYLDRRITLPATG